MVNMLYVVFHGLPSTLATLVHSQSSTAQLSFTNNAQLTHLNMAYRLTEM